MNKLGGRKFLLSVLGIVVIGTLAIWKADATAFGSIALIVTAFNGANGYIEGRHAGRDG